MKKTAAYYMNDEEYEAHCVNNHDALKDALKSILEWFLDNQDNNLTPKQYLEWQSVYNKALGAK